MNALVELCTLLLLTLHVTWAGSKAKNYFDDHYNKTKQGTDRISYPNRRRTQLYSRITRKHVQVLPNRGKVVARGNSGDRYASLIILTVSYGKVQIKGAATDRYICFDKRGHLISKKRPTSRCIFRERHDSKGFTEYESAKFKGKFLAFGRNGNARFKASTTFGTKVVQFVERPKPRKINNRYYRGKGRGITGWSSRRLKKLTRPKTRRTGLKSKPEASPLGFIVDYKDDNRRDQNKKRFQIRKQKNYGRRRWYADGKQGFFRKKSRKNTSRKWKYVNLAKETKLNRG